jgi:hypothetical protein
MAGRMRFSYAKPHCQEYSGVLAAGHEPEALLLWLDM